MLNIYFTYIKYVSVKKLYWFFMLNLLWGIVQYFIQIYKSDQRSDYHWNTHPPLNPNIRDQKNLYAYEVSFIHEIYSY